VICVSIGNSAYNIYVKRYNFRVSVSQGSVEALIEVEKYSNI